MGKQVDYLADTVGADGTVYPTVGENIRNIFNNQHYFIATFDVDYNKGIINLKSNFNNITNDKTHVYLDGDFTGFMCFPFITVENQKRYLMRVGCVDMLTSKSRIQFRIVGVEGILLHVTLRGFYYV